MIDYLRPLYIVIRQIIMSVPWGRKVFSFALPFFLALCSFIVTSTFKLDVIIQIIWFGLVYYASWLIVKCAQSLVFIRSFSDYRSSCISSHSVTQKFGRELIQMFLQDENFFLQKNMYIEDGPRHLQGLLRLLESEGMPLDIDYYKILLSQSGKLSPSLMYAIWNTIDIPLNADDYVGYFGILARQYDRQLQSKKKRIFLFKDKADFQAKTTSNEHWQKILEIHKDTFKFKEVHYCFRDQFEGVRASFFAVSDPLVLDDFILCKNFSVLGPDSWLIARQTNQGNKTYLFSSKSKRTLMEKTFQLYSELLKQLRPEQCIKLQ